ncbi:MAG: hypothetical protein HY074_12125 [Deltaproteobacteria bacterium]|nr:hypothetical protein [Deltaproteobacteria bacterium]
MRNIRFPLIRKSDFKDFQYSIFVENLDDDLAIHTPGQIQISTFTPRVIHIEAAHTLERIYMKRWKTFRAIFRLVQARVNRVVKTIQG